MEFAHFIADAWFLLFIGTVLSFFAGLSLDRSGNRRQAAYSPGRLLARVAGFFFGLFGTLFVFSILSNIWFYLF